MINLYKDLASLRPHWTITKAEWLEIKKQIKHIQACYNQVSQYIQNLSCGQDDYHMDQSSDYAKNTIKDIKKAYPWLSRLGNQDNLMNRYFNSNTWDRKQDGKIKHKYHSMNHYVYVGKEKSHKKPKMGFNHHVNTLSKLLENEQTYYYIYQVNENGVNIHSTHESLQCAIEFINDFMSGFSKLTEYNNGAFLKCFHCNNGSYYVITDHKLD